MATYLEIEVTTYNLRSETMLANISEMYESAENQARLQKHTADYQIATGGQKKHVIDSLIRRYPDSWDTMTPINLKIASKILSKLSRCYANGANREVINRETGVKNAPLTELFNYIYNDVDSSGRNFNSVMARANFYYSNHRYVELFTYIDQESGKLRFKPLPQNLFMALPDPTKTFGEVIVFKQSKSDFSEVRDYIDWDETPVEAVETTLDAIYTVWSKEDNFTFMRIKKVFVEEYEDNSKGDVVFRYAITSNDKNPQGKNPYGVRPFVGIKEATDGYFYPHGSEISEMSKEMNVILSDLVSIAAQQGFGQAVIYYSGEAPPALTKTGPTHVINIPNRDGNSSFQFANANPDLAGHLNIALSLIRILLTTNDLTTDKVSGELSATNFASAIDRLIADSETVEHIDDQRKKYVMAEKQQFKVMMAMLSYMQAVNAWPDDYPSVPSTLLNSGKFDIKVTFNTIKPLTTEKEKIDTISMMEEKGFILPWEKHLRFNDGMTEAEAKEREELIQASKKEKAKMFFEQQGVGNASPANQEDRSQEDNKERQEENRGARVPDRRRSQAFRQRDNRADQGEDQRRDRRPPQRPRV